MANLYAAFMGTAQVVTLFHFDKTISAECLRKAFIDYCKDHPFLLAVLAVQEDRWILEAGKKTEPDFEVLRLGKEWSDFNEIIENELNHSLNYLETLTQLKLIYLPENKGSLLVLVQNHSVTDTFTAKKIISELLHSLDMSKETVNLEQFPLYQRYATDQVAVKQPDHKAGILKGKDSDINGRLPSALRKMATDQPVRRSANMYWELDEKHVQHLSEYAGQRQVSLNSVLTTLFSFGVMQCLKLDDIRTYTAISYRKKNASYNATMGCLIDVADITIQLDNYDQAIWDYHQEMARIKDSMNDEVEAYSKIPAQYIPQDLTQESVLKASMGLGFTNSGDLDKMVFPNGVEFLHYRSVSNRNLGDLCILFHFGFYQKKMLVNMVFTELLFDEKARHLCMNQVQLVIEHFISHLEKSAREQE